MYLTNSLSILDDQFIIEYGVQYSILVPWLLSMDFLLLSLWSNFVDTEKEKKPKETPFWRSQLPPTQAITSPNNNGPNDRRSRSKTCWRIWILGGAPRRLHPLHIIFWPGKTGDCLGNFQLRVPGGKSKRVARGSSIALIDQPPAQDHEQRIPLILK